MLLYLYYQKSAINNVRTFKVIAIDGNTRALSNKYKVEKEKQCPYNLCDKCKSI